MPFPQSTIHNNPRVPFLLRQVITTSYVLSGYQNSTPWTNSNRMVHSTDTTVNLGNNLTAATGYPGNMSDDTYGYLLKANNGVGGASNAVIGFNMRTETGFGMPVSPYSVTNSSQAMQKEQQYAYVMATGAAQAYSKFQFATQTWIGNVSISYTTASSASANPGQMSEFYGYSYDDSNSTSLKLTFATDTQSGTGSHGGHGQQKSISSKVNYVYAGNEGSYNGGYTLRRFSWTTDTNVGNVSKPIGNCGEENFDMGQDHQYCMGNYDGSQNRRAWRFSYATDSGYEGGSSMQPQGPAGRSSAGCTWRS